jgi:hypothetical protein
MKTPAIIASLTVAGSIAFAAGQQNGGKQSLTLPSGAQAHSMQEEMPQARMAQMAGGCAPEPWFDPALRAIATGCATIMPLPLSPADVNGDGTQEVFASEGLFLAQGSPVSPLPPNALLQVGGVRVSADGVTPYRNTVAQIESPTIASLIAELPDTGSPVGNCFGHDWQIEARADGWIDADLDGDLDLVLTVTVRRRHRSPGEFGGCGWVTQTFSERTFWMENIGYEKPAPPLAADLNRDGQVDGADLGLLLVAWGPTP